MAAFATHLMRQEGNLASDWKVLPFQFIGATMLGVIALVAVLTNRDTPWK